MKTELIAFELIGEEREQQIAALQSQNDQQRNDTKGKNKDFESQILRLQTDIDDQRRNYEILREQQLQQVIGFSCVSTGGLALVFGFILLFIRSSLRSSMAKDARDVDLKYISNEKQTYLGNEVIPAKLRNNRPPILVDECEKFGLHEIYDVTAGEGGDLVRIARPLETAGAARKLSEELLNIQSIYQDQEGRESSGLQGTSPVDTKSGN